MTSTFFMECSLAERIRIILRTGLFLNILEYKSFNLHLYSAHGFYVEIKIDTITHDVESVRVVQGVDVEKYLAPLKSHEALTVTI